MSSAAIEGLQTVIENSENNSPLQIGKDMARFGQGGANHIRACTVCSREMKKAEFANKVDPDEVAHSEPPHLDLHCLPCSL